MCGADLDFLEQESQDKEEDAVKHRQKIFIQWDRKTLDVAFLGVRCLLKPKDLENMGKAIEEIGAAKTCITAPVIAETKRIVTTKGLDDAELYAASLTATDENVELIRVLKIFRKYNLPPEAMAQVLDKLGVIESGKW